MRNVKWCMVLVILFVMVGVSKWGFMPSLDNQSVKAAEVYGEWNSNSIYNNGDIVSYGGKLWIAGWWTQGQTPGTTGEWGVWKEYKSESTTTNTGTSVGGKLSVITINTQNGQEVTSKTEYISATAKIQKVQDSGVIYNGNIKIRGRGNSTWMVAKKPYRIKLETKTDLFGMGKNKDWVLLANFYDHSLMRNMLAFDFASKMGFLVSGFESVEVVMNGKNIGNYLLCEQVEIAEERVDIFDWEGAAEEISNQVVKKNPSLESEKERIEEVLVTDLNWATSGSFSYYGTTYKISDFLQVPDITGGYLLELDDTYDEVSKFKTTSGQPIMFKSPEYAKTNQKMFQYVNNYVQAFENAVKAKDFSATWEGKTVHYSELFDMDSLVDFWIITELFGNLDSMFKSTYMYKDSGELMKMGPLWDFDLCAGGSMVIEMQEYTQTWQTLYRQLSTAQSVQWYRYLIKDPTFLRKVYDRYHQVRKTFIEDIIKNNGKIDQYETKLAQSGQENLSLWPSNGGFMGFWPMGGQTQTQTGTYADKVSEVRTWMKKHVNWLDAQFASYDKLRSSLGAN